MLVKIEFLLAFLATIVVNLLCLVKISRSEKIYKSSLVSSICWSIPAVLANCLILFVKNSVVLTLSYSVFYLSLNWIIYFLLEFVCKYSKLTSKTYARILVVLFALDSVSLLLNVFFHHAFTIDLESLKVNFRIGYHIHICLDYFVSALIAVVLFYKIFKSPKIYRLKYVQVLIVFVIILISDAIYMVSGAATDFSIIFFSLGCITLAYFSFVHSPKTLENRLLTVIIQNLDDPIIFFNEENEYAFRNKAFDKFLEKYRDLGIDPEKPFKVWKETRNVPSESNFLYSDQRFSQEIEKDGKIFSFNIWLHNLKDEKGSFLGTFFQIHDRTKELEKDQKQKYLSTHDKLTGLLNKEAFYKKVEQTIKLNPLNQYVMLCLDIEHFKLINDLFGRKAGDDFLVRIAESLRQNVTTTEIYGRIGSDRFALLLEKQYFIEDLFTTQLEELSHIKENKFYSAVFHIGVYEIEDVNMSAPIICDRALMAIHSVKGSANIKIAYYTEKIRANVLNEQKYIGQFKDALKEKQFRFCLQPQITVNGECFGAEALARWYHPEDGLISPGEFIPIFEKNGIITELDKYIWEEAAKKLKSWKDAGCEDMYISVNISPKDVYALDIFEFFTELVEKYEINPKNLHLEITETAIMMNAKAQIELIDNLRRYGFLVEMDDFGSGYSSFNMLKDFCFDVIKIDMGFLRETLNKERSMAILKSIVILSKELKMPVVCEGVEKKEQRDYLADIGCDLFQGFYYDAPIPIQAFEKKYMPEYKEDSGI